MKWWETIAHVWLSIRRCAQFCDKTRQKRCDNQHKNCRRKHDFLNEVNAKQTATAKQSASDSHLASARKVSACFWRPFVFTCFTVSHFHNKVYTLFVAIWWCKKQRSEKREKQPHQKLATLINAMINHSAQTMTWEMYGKETIEWAKQINEIERGKRELSTGEEKISTFFDGIYRFSSPKRIEVNSQLQFWLITHSRQTESV